MPSNSDASLTSESPRDGMAPAVMLEGVRFGWPGNSNPDLAIDNLGIAPAEHLFVEGPSGSGKSTLLGLLAGVIVPQKGSVTILGESMNEMSASRRDQFRADHIGYLFQMFNLIPYLSVVENVTLPLRFSESRRMRVSDSGTEAGRLLKHLGMGELLHRPVTKLSVGQQQRVAAARALIGAPEIILADEPTSSLDAGHSERFVDLLFEECARAKSTLIFVSHDISLGSQFDRTFSLESK